MGVQVGEVPHCRLVLTNREAERIVGVKREKMYMIDGRHSERIAWEMFYPDGTPWPLEELPLPKAVWRGIDTHNEEMLLLGADGVARTILCNATPVRDSSGEILSGIVSFLEVTELKEAERSLLMSEARFKAITTTRKLMF